MNIREIANEINNRAKNYPFGKLQDIRKEIKGLSKKASSLIFTDQTISDDGWAFHYGGRKEIQYNIGIENEGLRYGLAFSLETSKSLPDLSILYPKILKLNSLVRNEPDLFIDYKMWYWQSSKRSKITNVFEIDDNLAKSGTFIFIGKLMDLNNIDFDEILVTFSTLMNIYQEIETEPNIHIEHKVTRTKFKFDNKLKKLPKTSSYNSIKREINVDVRHSILQEKLYNQLISHYGKENVGLENQINGNRIDVVVKINENKYIFYEVKTGSSAKSCIRQALGQLFEYAYWNNSGFNAEMIIAGEFKIDKTTSEYIEYIRRQFKIPISYYCIE